MIAPNQFSIWPRVLAVLALVGAIFMAGCAFEGWRKEVEIADLKRDAARQKENDATTAQRVLLQALARGDALTHRLSVAQAAIESLTEEKKDAIRRLTVGRPCLGGAAVRVLNQPAGLQPAAVPAAASEPAADDAAFATDTDVGIWIATCQRGYDTCRGRLQAVADFFAPSPADMAEQ